MASPVPSWNTVRVQGRWLNQNGSLKAGTYTVTMPVRVTNVTDDSIIPAGVFAQGALATVAGALSFDLQIPSGNDPDNSPSGWKPLLSISFTDGTATETYALDLSMTLVGNATGLKLVNVVFPSDLPSATANMLIRGVAGGIAGLDSDGDVVNAAGVKVINAGGSGGAVASVNSKSGVVVLTADDLADTSAKKIMTAAERTKLAGIATGASANSTDAFLLNRTNQSGTQVAATIPDFAEAAQDATAALFAAGTHSGISFAYSDAGNALSATVTGGTSGTAANPRPGYVTVASSTAPADVRAQADYVGDGTADQVEISAAIASLATSRGMVRLIGPSFSVTGTSPLRTGVRVTGDSLGTIITAASDFNEGIFTLYDDGTHATELDHLTINGNGRGVHGLHYNADGGQIFTSSPATNPDPYNTVHNLLILNCGTSSILGHAMWMDGANLRAGRYSDIRIQTTSGCGVFVDGAVDSHWTNIDVGGAGSSGTYSMTTTAPSGAGFWFGAGDNNMISNCKAWYCRGDGFVNRGTRNSFVGCQAQDNYSYGFRDVYGKSIFSGCVGDSNGQAVGSSSRGQAGFYFAAQSVKADVISFDRGGQSWAQQYGVQLTSGCTYSRVNAVTYTNAVAASTGTAGTGTTVDIQGDSAGK